MPSVAVNLTGKRFGRWRVIRRHSATRNKRTYWLCECDCGVVKKVLAEHLKSGASTSCGCKRFDINGPVHHQWEGCGELGGRVWTEIVSNSNRLKKQYGREPVEFDLTKEFLWELFQNQGGLCAISGAPISIKYIYQKIRPTASLDRIDSLKGYTKDNVHWVHKDINIMKNRYDLNYFIDMCLLVASHNNVLDKDVTAIMNSIEQ